MQFDNYLSTCLYLSTSKIDHANNQIEYFNNRLENLVSHEHSSSWALISKLNLEIVTDKLEQQN